MRCARPHEGLQFEKQVKRAQECRQLQAGDWEAGLVAFGSTARRSTTPVVKARKDGDRVWLYSRARG
jgi:hypothetical protein